MTTTQSGRGRKRRGRGETAGIDLAAIVKAARGIHPDQLTMQAVADVLGVDRKAPSHYVRDRETLLALVAFDAFTERFSHVRVGPSDDWRQAARNFARALVDGLTATGPLVEHLSLSDTASVGMYAPSEQLTGILISAGFSDEATARTLALLTTICVGHVRDSAMSARYGDHPRNIFLQRALQQGKPHQFDNLARIAASGLNLYDDEQFEISIEIFLNGVNAVIGPGDSGAAGRRKRR